MFESKSKVKLIAGFSLVTLPLVIVSVWPSLTYPDQLEQSLADLVADGMIHEFVELAERFPDSFNKHFPNGVTQASFTEALTIGHKVYVSEGCWHCHTQLVRPVANDNLRWGPVSSPQEYQNILQRPALIGTRRIGPDLFREGARRSNDWHVAHFFKPTSVSPTSVMPRYLWFYDENHYPNKRGLAIITYMQWLGSWLPEYPHYQGK